MELHTHQAATPNPTSEQPIEPSNLNKEVSNDSATDHAELDDTWTISPAEAEHNRLEAERVHLQNARNSLVSTLSYLTISPSNTKSLHTTTATRWQVQSSLLYIYHLRAHLHASVTILDTYSDTDFSIPHLVPSASAGFGFSDLAKDQIQYTHHHSAISETLQVLNHHPGLPAFGLPCNGAFRNERNHFCHGLLTPGGTPWWAELVKMARERNERLLRQVVGTLGVLEGALGEEGVWVQRVEKEEPEEVVSWGAGFDEGVHNTLEGERGSAISSEGEEDEDLDESPLTESSGTGFGRRWSASHFDSMERGWTECRSIDFLLEEEYEHLRR